MTYLFTVRPGPVLHVWLGGQEVAAVPMDVRTVLQVCRDLLSEVQFGGQLK
jgi:hypothetical protein